MTKSHRSVILGTLVTHCLLGSGKSGASLFRGAVNGDGTHMGMLLQKKRGRIDSGNDGSDDARRTRKVQCT